MVKKSYIIIVLLLLLFSLTIVSSADTNSSDKKINIIKKDTVPAEDNSLPEKIEKKSNPVKKESVNKTSSKEGCCSVVVQASENESAISYRRDSTLAATIYVTENSGIVKQYKESGSYFVHTMISKDGWLVGSGGIDEPNVVRNVEKECLKIIKDNKLTDTSIRRIENQKKKLSIAHFVIKSPSGDYYLLEKYNGRQYSTRGKLKNGEFIVVPNSPGYFDKGNYEQRTKTSDVSLACRLLCASDKFGVNRRNIITYHFKTNSVKSTINVTATNDNGRYVGRSTGGLKDNIKAGNTYIKASQLPVINKFIHVKTFEYKLRNARTKVLMNDVELVDASMTLKANVVDEFNNRVNDGKVLFSLNGKNVVDKKGNKVFISVKDGVALLNHYDPNVLKYRFNNVTATFLGTENFSSSNSNSKLVNNAPKIVFNVERNTALNDIIHIRANITLLDGSILKNGTAVIRINGKTLSRSNGDLIEFKIKNGKISYDYRIPYNFPQNNVNISIEYTGNGRKTSASRNLFVSKSNASLNFVTLRANKKLLKVRSKLVDNIGNKIRINTNVMIKLNNTVLSYMPDNISVRNGILSFDINLNNKYPRGGYILTFFINESKYTKNSIQKEFIII